MTTDLYRPRFVYQSTPGWRWAGRNEARAKGWPTAATVALGLCCAPAPLAPIYATIAQEAPTSSLSPYDGRPVRDVRFEGLARVSDRFARNQIRTIEGQAFDAALVTEDIRRLFALYEFETVEASVSPHDDGSVSVIFTASEAPIVQDVQVVGNRQIPDADLAAEVSRINLVAGVPMDRFRIDRARRGLEDLYRARGHHTARVEVDDAELANGIVLFRIREGERVRLMALRFDGARSFPEDRLRQQVRTKTATLLRRGGLDDESLDNDVNSLVRFYQTEGFLDVRVDRRLTVAPNSREAIATFLIDEGPRYRLRSVSVTRLDGADTPTIFSPEQVIGLIPTKPGDAYANNAGIVAAQTLLRAYNQLGYVDADVRRQELRDPDRPLVDLVLQVIEGDRFRVGEVVVQGNTITKQNVIRRELRFWPDRPLDVQALDESRRRLQQTRLFARPSPQLPEGGARITLQPEDPRDPGYRDVLVEIEDAETGSITFIAAVSADAGLIGQVAITERNFDLFNLPRRPGEILSRQRFRGAGQTFEIVVAPGTEVRNFALGLTEPYLLESDISLSVNGSFRDRLFDDYDEERLRATLSLGRRFGDRWQSSLSFRTDTVQLQDIDADAPVDAFEVADQNTIFGFGVGVTRTTVPPTERTFPTRGSRSTINLEQVVGDFTFNRITASHTFFVPVSQDAVGRTSVLSFQFNAGWIPQTGDAPIYERFFQGGSNFRGFDFRGVSPRGIANNTGLLGRDPNGGHWSFFAGVEYNRPIFQDVIAVVGFVDSGTVLDDIGFEDYRLSVGAGLRIRVPALGPIPLAFDFGFPILKETGDDRRLFTFTADIPF